MYNYGATLWIPLIVSTYCEPMRNTILISKEGKETAIENSTVPVRDEKGNIGGIILIFRDITKSRQAEDALRSLEKAVETMQLGVTITDSKGKIVYTNSAEAKTHGYEVKELIGKDVRIFASRKQWEPMTSGQMKKIRSWRRESLNIRKDGSMIPVQLMSDVVTNSSGEPIGIVTTCEDITERKRAGEELKKYQNHLEKLVEDRTIKLSEAINNLKNEIKERKLAEKELKKTNEALRKSEDRFRKIFEQNEDAIMIFRYGTCNIIDVNPSAVRLYGYTRQEFFDHGVRLFLDQSESQNFKKAICDTGSRSGFTIDSMNNRKKDGTKIIVTIRGKVISLENNQVLYCVFQDITEKIRLEREAMVRQAQLFHANKMSSLGMMVSSIVHEINNPNNFVMFNTQLISEAWQDALNILNEYHQNNGEFFLGGLPYSEMHENIPRLLTGISEGCRRINNIVGNLKDFARPDKDGLNGVVDINHVIKAAVTILDNQIRKYTNHFHVDFEENVSPIKGSSQQLEQVIINLVMNSLQALPDKQCGIWISTSINRELRHVKVKVRDEGVGMSKEVLAQVLEPFHTTKYDMGGTGLGLFISYSIIREHKGILEFSSDVGKGTTATIILPVQNGKQ